MPLAASEIMTLAPTGREKVVKIRVQRNGEVWTLSGKTWDDVVASDFKETIARPRFGETQIWEIENKGGGWFHPVHIHLIDFQILTRNGKPRMAHEAGPKDVVYVGENEKVRLLCKFQTPSNRRGRYMVHCHNLPHEDHDMMTQFAVGLDDFDNDPNHPIFADPAVPDPTYQG